MRLGIATIYQELDLVAGLSSPTTSSSAASGRGSGSPGPRRRNRAASQLLTRLGHPEIRPGAEVGSLSAAAQQMVSMARALSQDARLIIMDEPSAVLDDEEVERLFRRHPRPDRGRRRGRLHLAPARGDPPDRRPDHRAQGRPHRRHRPAGPGHPDPRADHADDRPDDRVRLPARRTEVAADAAPLLEVEGLGLRGRFSDVSFTVAPGEIVGLAGLVGSGRSEILETVYGARKATAGTVRVDGQAAAPRVASAAVAAGLGLAPEERKSQGLLLDDPRLPQHHHLQPGPVRPRRLPRRRRRARSGRASRSQALDVRPADVDRVCGPCRAATSRRSCWRAGCCATAGCSCSTSRPAASTSGARAEIYALIRALADRGVAVVVVSSEIEEVLGLADRVLVDRARARRHRGTGRRARRAPGARPRHGRNAACSDAARTTEPEGDVA